MDALGAAGHGIKADEVTALGVVPGASTGTAQIALQHGQNHVKLGLQQLGVLLHMSLDTGHILKVTDVTQLVDLVVGDHLGGDQLGHVLDVLLGGGHDADARTGEGDLAGGGELEDHVGAAGLGTHGNDIGEGDEIAYELMDTVGVVPHDDEVGGGGLHVGHPLGGDLGVGVALGVGVLGHAPDALDHGIPDQVLHHVHIGAVGGHGHGDELEAKALRDPEVAVIAGGGAEELDPLLLAPGAHGLLQAVGVGPGDQVVHQGQGGVAADEGLLGLAAQDVGPVFPGAPEARQIAVVAGIVTVEDAVVGVGENGEDIADGVKLQLAGLTAGHIQLQALSLKTHILLTQRLFALDQLLAGHIQKTAHVSTSFLARQSAPYIVCLLLYKISLFFASLISYSCKNFAVFCFFMKNYPVFRIILRKIRYFSPLFRHNEEKIRKSFEKTCKIS